VYCIIFHISFYVKLPRNRAFLIAFMRALQVGVLSMMLVQKLSDSLIIFNKHLELINEIKTLEASYASFLFSIRVFNISSSCEATIDSMPNIFPFHS